MTKRRLPPDHEVRNDGRAGKNSYTLQWEIDWDADTPKQAAQEVIREFFGNIGAADHFTVIDQETGEMTEVDAFSDDSDDEDETA